MEKQLNAYVATFGEEKKNNAVTATRETSEPLFDNERSPAPRPGSPVE
jgi:hypothetical protein